ncbi:hypothetical protein FGRMN_2650 [Fusarium graminum]|nr:hypothetical protein FGRMN_2650 [Fusarium graminum]
MSPRRLLHGAPATEDIRELRKVLGFGKGNRDDITKFKRAVRKHIDTFIRNDGNIWYLSSKWMAEYQRNCLISGLTIQQEDGIKFRENTEASIDTIEYESAQKQNKIFSSYENHFWETIEAKNVLKSEEPHQTPCIPNHLMLNNFHVPRKSTEWEDDDSITSIATAQEFGDCMAVREDTRSPTVDIARCPEYPTKTSSND